MWFGLCNFFIVMMYVFGVCVDCVVWDELFYVFYLKYSDWVYFMQDEIFVCEEIDLMVVVKWCVGFILDNKLVFY